MNFISMDARQALADLDDPRASIPIKRNVAADLVAALIDFLDETELDADLEPSLAGFNVGPYEPLRGVYDLEPDCDEDDDTENEPLLGWTEHESCTGRTAESTYAGGYLDGEIDDGDNEPSLGSVACSAPTVAAFGWWKVRPYYLSEAAWAAHLAEQRGEAVAVYAGSQETWSDGRGGDREDEHDGAEPENEHGPSWAEGPARCGSLFSGSDEDDEPSLSLTEHINQETRLRRAQDVGVEDAEADYVDRFGRSRIADDRESANEDGGDVQDEPHDDGDDDEPSLATPEPYYAGADYYLARQSFHVSCPPLTSQASWGLGGSRGDLEHEHDGAEPENEHGPSWAEAPARRGSLVSGSDEDHEPSLSLTEHVNQATRTTMAIGWFFDDAEADYARDIGLTNRAVLADDEPDVTDREDDGICQGERDETDLDAGLMIVGGNERVAP